MAACHRVGGKKHVTLCTQPWHSNIVQTRWFVCEEVQVASYPVGQITTKYEACRIEALTETDPKTHYQGIGTGKP